MTNLCLVWPAPTKKRCTQCTVTKPLADFYGHVRTVDKLQRKCKACSVPRGPKLIDKEGTRAALVEKTCARCGETKKPDAFARHEKRIDGLQANCRACFRHYRKEYGEQNKCGRAESKRCPRCGETKPAKKFSHCATKPGGLVTYCKPCESIARRERKFRMPRGEILERIEAQRGLCAICSQAIVKDYYVDHCHKTGRVRGLLCQGCNLGIGHFRENCAALMGAVAYLTKENGK